MNNEIFISYVQPNRDFAFRIHDALQANNFRSWIAPSQNYGIKAGEYHGGEIIKAIRSCKFFLLIFSSYTNISAHIKREVYNAEGKKIIIIKLDKSPFDDDLCYYLNGLEYINAYENKLDEVINLLLNQLKKSFNSSEHSFSTDKFLFNQGLRLLENKSYKEAEKVLTQFVRIDTNNFDAKFYLVLSMMQGKKPKKLDGLLVKAIEKILYPYIVQYQTSKILLAIIKYGYYTLNGFIETSPTSQKLLSSLSEIDKLQAQIILNHLEDFENPVWQLLYKYVNY